MMEALKVIKTHAEKMIQNKARVQQHKRLSRFSICILTAFLLTVTLVLVGCDSDDPQVQCPPAQHVDNFRKPESVSSLRTLPSPDKVQLLPYTGRDSFGIALDAAVVGIAEAVSAGGDSSLVEITGTGQSALLGKIDITQIHFIDLSSNEISGGRFTFRSESGEVVSGTYEGSRTPVGEGFTINALAKITGGAVECTPTALESGWGWINGSLKDNQWEYELEGWLFHHAEIEE